MQGLLPWSAFLADAGPGEHLYDRQLASWMEGRWDLPTDGGERWLVDGRFYLYFGPLPVLLRVPFADWVLANLRKSASISTTAGALLVFGAALALTRRVLGRDPPRWFAVALTAPVLLIASRTAIYHEAIVWGASLALLATLAFLRYLNRPSLCLLVALIACGLLAVHARALWLPAMTLLMSLVGFAGWLARSATPRDVELRGSLGLPAPARPGTHLLAAAAGAFLLVASVPGVNFLKCGHWVFELPLAAQARFRADPARLADVAGRQFHIVNVPTTAWAYFSPSSIEYRSSFPWIRPLGLVRLLPAARITDQDSMLSLWHVMGALLFLTCRTIARARRDPSARGPALVVVALLLSPLALLFFIAICGRYLFDFYPALVLGGALGLRSTAERRRVWPLALLATYNLVAATSVALADQQRRGRFGHDRQVSTWGQAVDRALGVDDGRVVEPAAPTTTKPAE